MDAETAVGILKKYEFIRDDWSVEDFAEFMECIGFKENEKRDNWGEAINAVLMIKYIGEEPPDIPVFIEELGIRYGGTVSFEIKVKNETKEEGV